MHITIEEQVGALRDEANSQHIQQFANENADPPGPPEVWERLRGDASLTAQLILLDAVIAAIFARGRDPEVEGRIQAAEILAAEILAGHVDRATADLRQVAIALADATGAVFDTNQPRNPTTFRAAWSGAFEGMRPGWSGHSIV